MARRLDYVVLVWCMPLTAVEYELNLAYIQAILYVIIELLILTSIEIRFLKIFCLDYYTIDDHFLGTNSLRNIYARKSKMLIFLFIELDSLYSYHVEPFPINFLFTKFNWKINYGKAR